MASPLTPDDIKNAPPGETVSSVLLNKNLRRIKRPNEKNKVGFQGKTNKPIEAGVKPVSAGYKAKPVEAGVPSFTSTPQYKNYVEKPPWQRLQMYDANNQFSVLKEMYRYYDLGKVVHPGLALGTLFSPALNSESISFLFRGENFRNKLKELSEKYQPETIGDFLKEGVATTGSVLKRGLNLAGSIFGGNTASRAFKADDYARFKALDKILTTEEKAQIGWSGKYDESQVQNYLPDNKISFSAKETNPKIAVVWEAMKRPEYQETLKGFGSLGVKDVAKEYWSDIISSVKDEPIKETAKKGTTQNLMQTVGARTQFHKNPVLSTLMEINVDPATVLFAPSAFGKAKLLSAVKAGKFQSLTNWLPQLEKADTLGEFAFRVGLRDGWNKAGSAVKSIIDTPIFKKLANEGGFLKLGGKTGGDTLLTKFMTAVQDDWHKVRKMVNKEGAKVTDASDPYLARELHFKLAENKLTEAKNAVINIDKDILTASKKLKIDDKQFAKDVDKYLHFAHAPERNRAIGKGAAGVTTKEAIGGLKKLNKQPHFKEIKRVADDLRKLHGQTLDTLLEAQVIDKKFYNTLKTKYPYHVPLNRMFDESEDVAEIFVGRGFDVKTSGIQRAKGSEREVADITTNIIHNLNQAIIRAEKNKVDLVTLQFVRDNKKIFGDIFEEVKPKAIGRSFGGGIITKRVTDPQILTLREAGKPVYIKIKDPTLAVALRGVNREQLSGGMRLISSVTRLYSGLMTRFNPEFAIPNKLRDFQEMLVFMASKKEIGFRGAAGTITKDVGSMKGVVDFMRGKDTAGAKLYNELQELGGTIGGMATTTRKSVELDIAKIRKLNRSKPRQAVSKIVDAVDNWNTVFEDSTRLSVYRQGLKQGLSKKRAAALAKEATIDFNRKGTKGQAINALYMFANASIQGSVKMLRAMKNPKVAATVSATIFGANAAVQRYNDSIDPQWRGKVSPWDRLNGLNIALPSSDGKFNYVTVPVSWGLKPINAIASHSLDFMNNKRVDIEKAAQSIFSSVMDAYNPAGGTDFISSVTPTIGDIPADIARNRTWAGSLMRPENDKYAPGSEKYFDDLKDDIIGKPAITATKKISELSGGRIEVSPADVTYVIEQLIGGVGRTVTKTANTISGLAKKDVKARDIPFVSRFFRSRNEDEIIQRGTEVDELTETLTEQSRTRIQEKRDAERDWLELKKLPQKEGDRFFQQLTKTNPKRAELIFEIYEEEQLGLDYTERLIKQLGVENGERAKYIYKKLQSLSSDKEREKYYNNLMKKKLISEKVYEQLNKKF